MKRKKKKLRNNNPPKTITLGPGTLTFVNSETKETVGGVINVSGISLTPMSKLVKKFRKSCTTGIGLDSISDCLKLKKPYAPKPHDELTQEMVGLFFKGDKE